MKLIGSCQHSSFCFSVSHSCALTNFPGYSTGCFCKGKHCIKKIFPVPDPIHIWLYEGYCRVEATSVAKDWEMHSSQSFMCYLSQMPYMLLDPLACGAGWQALWWQTRSETGAGLNWRCFAEANGGSGVKHELCRTEIRAILISAS